MTLTRRTVLAGAGVAASALSPVTEAIARGSQGSFPRDFLWGASTAAHQVEGNNLNADLWVLENLPNTMFADRSGDAANSFELWPVDLDLVKSLGLNTYRFSLEWARIEPDPGQFSNAMLDHYKAMIDGCRKRGIHPVVTFNHFTTPRWFAERNGWHNPEAPQLFARFCDRAARHLAHGIGHALTLNEPNLAGLVAELLPGDLLAGDRALHEAAARKLGVEKYTSGIALYLEDRRAYTANQIAGHKLGREAIKAVRADMPVGVSLAIIDDQAAGTNSVRDRMRERYYGEWLRVVAKTCDFIGVQNYERKIWDEKGLVPVAADARRNMAGAEVWAGSLAGAVRYAWEATQLPVIVTEHGVNTADDSMRAWLIPAALAELRKAIDEGIPVKGYLHWSLIDNFEWGFGYTPRFGLCALDRRTFRRTPKPSAAVLGNIARRNALP